MEKIATSFCSFGCLRKRYAQYKCDERPVTHVGVNFRTAKRNIDEPFLASFGGLGAET